MSSGSGSVGAGSTGDVGVVVSNSRPSSIGVGEDFLTLFLSKHPAKNNKATIRSLLIPNLRRVNNTLIRLADSSPGHQSKKVLYF